MGPRDLGPRIWAPGFGPQRVSGRSGPWAPGFGPPDLGPNASGPNQSDPNPSIPNQSGPKSIGSKPIGSKSIGSQINRVQTHRVPKTQGPGQAPLLGAPVPSTVCNNWTVCLGSFVVMVYICATSKTPTNVVCIKCAFCKFLRNILQMLHSVNVLHNRCCRNVAFFPTT